MHSLELKVQRGLCMKGAVRISQERPEELYPAISQEKTMPVVVHLEERSRSTKLYLCLFQGAVEEVTASRVAITDFQEESEGCSTLFPV